MITEYPVTTSARYHAFTWNVLVPAQYGAIAAIRQTPSLANSGRGLDISAGHSTQIKAASGLHGTDRVTIYSDGSGP